MIIKLASLKVGITKLVITKLGITSLSRKVGIHKATLTMELRKQGKDTKLGKARLTTSQESQSGSRK